MEKEQKQLLRRLSIIRGQINGIVKMIENNEDCIKILTQMKAAKSAFNSVSNEMVKKSLKNCSGKLPQGGVDEKKFDELFNLFSRF